MHVRVRVAAQVPVCVHAHLLNLSISTCDTAMPLEKGNILGLFCLSSIFLLYTSIKDAAGNRSVWHTWSSICNTEYRN